jgi:hypothetical protein
VKIPLHHTLTNFYTRALGGGRAIALGIVVVIAPTPAITGVKVSGNPNAVSVEAQDSSIDEILTALCHEFPMQYRTSIELKTPITGAYHGPLLRLLARVLEGNNYVVKLSPDDIEVTVLGRQHGIAAGEREIAEKSGPISQSEQQSLSIPLVAIRQPGATALPPIEPKPGTRPVGRRASVSSAVSVPGPVFAAQSVAVPIPIVSGSGRGLIPDLRPATVAPPMPQPPSLGPANNPGPITHAPGVN